MKCIHIAHMKNQQTVCIYLKSQIQLWDRGCLYAVVCSFIRYGSSSRRYNRILCEKQMPTLRSDGHDVMFRNGVRSSVQVSSYITPATECTYVHMHSIPANNKDMARVLIISINSYKGRAHLSLAIFTFNQTHTR